MFNCGLEVKEGAHLNLGIILGGKSFKTWIQTLLLLDHCNWKQNSEAELRYLKTFLPGG